MLQFFIFILILNITCELHVDCIFGYICIQIVKQKKGLHVILLMNYITIKLQSTHFFNGIQNSKNARNMLMLTFLS